MNTLLLVLFGLLAGTLCFCVWKLSKAGGRVRVGFKVDVRWGKAEGAKRS